MRTVVVFKNDISDAVSTLLVNKLLVKVIHSDNDIGNVIYKNSS